MKRTTATAAVHTPPRRARSLLGPLAFWEADSGGSGSGGGGNASSSTRSRRERARQWLINNALVGARLHSHPHHHRDHHHDLDATTTASSSTTSSTTITATTGKTSQPEEAPSTPVGQPTRRGGPFSPFGGGGGVAAAGRKKLPVKQFPLPPPFLSSARHSGPMPKL